MAFCFLNSAQKLITPAIPGRKTIGKDDFILEYLDTFIVHVFQFLIVSKESN